MLMRPSDRIDKPVVPGRIPLELSIESIEYNKIAPFNAMVRFK
jgi:hypothetical protein